MGSFLSFFFRQIVYRISIKMSKLFLRYSLSSIINYQKPLQNGTVSWEQGIKMSLARGSSIINAQWI